MPRLTSSTGFLFSTESSPWRCLRTLVSFLNFFFRNTPNSFRKEEIKLLFRRRAAAHVIVDSARVSTASEIAAFAFEYPQYLKTRLQGTISNRLFLQADHFVLKVP